MEHPLVSFYLNKSSTPEGYTLEEIWGWGHENLEYTHTYIQWLFPLREKSNFNLSAPTIDDNAIREFSTNQQLHENLIKSFRIMLNFYGFTLDDKGGKVVINKAPDFEEKKTYWLNPYNHNFLRITRILTSLTLLGCKEYAAALLLCLNGLRDKYHHDISENTFNYWNNAVKIG